MKQHLHTFNPPPAWARPFLRKSLHWFRWHKLLPTTRWGDALYAHLLPLYFNDYWPSKMNGSLNDMIAYFKCSPLIASPLYQQVSDKVLVKEYIRQKLGPDWCVPTLAVLHDDREIDAYEFPDRCVVKPTHSSGQTLFREGGEPVNRALLKQWLRYSHYRAGRERNYRGLVPKLIVEPWIEFRHGFEFRLLTVHGQPTSLWAMVRPQHGQPILLGDFDANGKYLMPERWEEAQRQEEILNRVLGLEALERVNQAARKVVEDLVFARVDFHQDGATVQIGEITLCPGNGLWRWGDAAMEEARKKGIFGERGFNLEDFPQLLFERNS